MQLLQRDKLSSIGLKPKPTLDFSATLGNNNLIVGGKVAFNTEEGAFSKYNIGASLITTSYLIASLTPDLSCLRSDKFDTLTASCYHAVGNTAVGAEVAHCFSRDEETVAIGVQCALNRMTTASTRVNNFGKASIVMRHEMRPVSIVTFSAEVDTRSIVESTKFGLALALK